ncbi:MAG: DUF3467 domain-containing protein [bacterium]
MEQKAVPTQQQIEIKDMFAGAEYANGMQIGHNKEEFLLTFINLAGGNGRVCGKIITTPAHVKRMILAMQDNLKQYEATFGKVEQAEAPKEQMGFKV